MLPTPQSASSVSDGFDQLGDVEPQRPVDPELPEDAVDRARSPG